jgi:hypothetical protein
VASFQVSSRSGWAEPSDLSMFKEDEQLVQNLDMATLNAVEPNHKNVIREALTELKRPRKIFGQQVDAAEEKGGGTRAEEQHRGGGDEIDEEIGVHIKSGRQRRRLVWASRRRAEREKAQRKGPKGKVGVTWDEQIDLDEVEEPALERPRKRVKRTPHRESAKKGPVRKEGGRSDAGSRAADVQHSNEKGAEAVLVRRQALSAAIAEESSDEDVDFDWPLEKEGNGAQSVASLDEEDDFGQGRVVARGRKRRQCAVLSDEEGDGGAADALELGALQENFLADSAPRFPAMKGMGGQTGPSKGVRGFGPGNEPPEDAQKRARSTPEAVHRYLGDFDGAGANGFDGVAKPPGVQSGQLDVQNPAV